MYAFCSQGANNGAANNSYSDQLKQFHGNKARFDEMKEFFGDVGQGYAAGVWEDTPKDVPAYREKYKKQIEAAAKKRKAEEMI
mgnify:CR=1 FL=1